MSCIPAFAARKAIAAKTICLTRMGYPPLNGRFHSEKDPVHYGAGAFALSSRHPSSTIIERPVEVHRIRGWVRIASCIVGVCCYSMKHLNGVYGRDIVGRGRKEVNLPIVICEKI